MQGGGRQRGDRGLWNPPELSDGNSSASSGSGSSYPSLSEINGMNQRAMSGWGGGGADLNSSISQIAALVGLMTESLEMSLEMGANQEFKYGQTINGKWRSKEVVARVHTITSNKYAKYAGIAGKVLGVYGTINALKKTMEDPSNTANWVKLGANAGLLALKANPYTLVASIGFTVLDEGGYIDEWVGK